MRIEPILKIPLYLLQDKISLFASDERMRVRLVPTCPIYLWSFLLLSPLPNFMFQQHYTDIPYTEHLMLSPANILLHVLFSLPEVPPLFIFLETYFPTSTLSLYTSFSGKHFFTSSSRTIYSGPETSACPSPSLVPFLCSNAIKLILSKLSHASCLCLDYECPFFENTNPINLHLINSFFSFKLSSGATCSRKPPLNHRVRLSTHFCYPKALNVSTSNCVKFLISVFLFR